MKPTQSRRDFIKKTAIASSMLPLVSSVGVSALGKASQPATLPPILLFSKHLQFLNYEQMARQAKEIGFDGIDLTVRPKGHVLPERVRSDLPKAVAAIKQAGLNPMMMTTAVERAAGTDEVVLRTAAEQGIKYYRMNWYKYSEQESMPATIAKYQEEIGLLSQLNAKLGLVGCYQNHAGKLIGASAWELYQLMQKADSPHMGLQYDIRHATVEGGLSWENGLRLLHPHIQVLAVKDFIWEQRNGKWNVKNVPMGEGMVDFKTFFKLLKQYKVQVPISMHYEYDLGGAEHGDQKISIDPTKVFEAMKKDLVKVKQLWSEA